MHDVVDATTSRYSSLSYSSSRSEVLFWDLSSIKELDEERF